MKSLGLRKNEERLLIADVFKGQWRPAIKKELADLNGKMVTVPSNMANHFQTLDLTVNRSGKARQLESGKQPENVKIDTRLIVISTFMLNGSSLFTTICKTIGRSWLGKISHYKNFEKLIQPSNARINSTPLKFNLSRPSDNHSVHLT